MHRCQQGCLPCLQPQHQSSEELTRNYHDFCSHVMNLRPCRLVVAETANVTPWLEVTHLYHVQPQQDQTNISRSELVMYSTGLYSMLTSAVMSSGHLAQNTAKTHAFVSPVFVPPTPFCAFFAQGDNYEVQPCLYHTKRLHLASWTDLSVFQHFKAVSMCTPLHRGGEIHNEPPIIDYIFQLWCTRLVCLVREELRHTCFHQQLFLGKWIWLCPAIHHMGEPWHQPQCTTLPNVVYSLGQRDLFANGREHLQYRSNLDLFSSTIMALLVDCYKTYKGLHLDGVFGFL